MDALGFVKEMQNEPEINSSKLSAKEYFETTEGKKMIRIISREVVIINEKSFKLVDRDFIKRIENNPLYKGRHFFVDMRSLGFDYQIISRHQDEAPVCTYLFEVK